MPNMTMTVESDILKKARKFAVENNTTLSALVRQYLERLAAREDQKIENAIKELNACFSDKNVVIGERTWTRDDLHERR